MVRYCLLLGSLLYNRIGVSKIFVITVNFADSHSKHSSNYDGQSNEVEVYLVHVLNDIMLIRHCYNYCVYSHATTAGLRVSTFSI